MPRFILAAIALAGTLACSVAVAQQEYLYVWTAGVAGVGDGSDKLVTVDATRPSLRYGRVIHTLSVGGRGDVRELSLGADGRTLRAGRAGDGKVFEFDVGTDPARPRLLRVAAGTPADNAPAQAGDARRVFVAGAAAKPEPDAEHFVRGFNREGDALGLVFAVDFRAPQLGMPRALVFVSR